MPIRPASASSIPASLICPSRPRRPPRRCCGGSSLPGMRALLPGHRDGRAPQGPAGAGAGLRRGGRAPGRRGPRPGRPARMGRGGAGRPPSPPRGARERIVRTGWVEASRPGGVAVPGQPCWPTPPSTKDSGSRRCRPCAPGCRWWRRGRARCPRCSATAPCWSTSGDHDGLAEALASCLGDEVERRRLIAAGTAWSARYSWERCGDELEALYRDAAAGRG